MSDKRVFLIALATSVAVLALFQVGKIICCRPFRGCPPPQCRKMCPKAGMPECAPAPAACPTAGKDLRNPAGGPRFFVQCPQCQTMICLQDGLRNGPRMQRMGHHNRRMKEGKGEMFRQGKKGAIDGRKEMKDRKHPKNGFDAKTPNAPGKDGVRPLPPPADSMLPGEGPILPPPAAPVEVKAEVKAGAAKAAKADVKADVKAEVKTDAKADTKAAK